jgi:DNA-binding HxlR family transcriptional regulator
LTPTSRARERDGLVSRALTPTIPPRVDYAITFLGYSLLEPSEELGNWSFTHVDSIDEARRTFDKRGKNIAWGARARGPV